MASQKRQEQKLNTSASLNTTSAIAPYPDPQLEQRNLKFALGLLRSSAEKLKATMQPQQLASYVKRATTLYLSALRIYPHFTTLDEDTVRTILLDISKAIISGTKSDITILNDIKSLEQHFHTEGIHLPILTDVLDTSLDPNESTHRPSIENFINILAALTDQSDLTSILIEKEVDLEGAKTKLAQAILKKFANKSRLSDNITHRLIPTFIDHIATYPRLLMLLDMESAAAQCSIIDIIASRFFSYLEIMGVKPDNVCDISPERAEWIIASLPIFQENILALIAAKLHFHFLQQIATIIEGELSLDESEFTLFFSSCQGEELLELLSHSVIGYKNGEALKATLQTQLTIFSAHRIDSSGSSALEDSYSATDDVHDRMADIIGRPGDTTINERRKGLMDALPRALENPQLVVTPKAAPREKKLVGQRYSNMLSRAKQRNAIATAGEKTTADITIERDSHEWSTQDQSTTDTPLPTILSTTYKAYNPRPPASVDYVFKASNTRNNAGEATTTPLPNEAEVALAKRREAIALDDTATLPTEHESSRWTTQDSIREPSRIVSVDMSVIPPNVTTHTNVTDLALDISLMLEGTIPDPIDKSASVSLPDFTELELPQERKSSVVETDLTSTTTTTTFVPPSLDVPSSTIHTSPYRSSTTMDTATNVERRENTAPDESSSSELSSSDDWGRPVPRKRLQSTPFYPPNHPHVVDLSIVQPPTPLPADPPPTYSSFREQIDEIMLPIMRFHQETTVTKKRQNKFLSETERTCRQILNALSFYPMLQELTVDQKNAIHTELLRIFCTKEARALKINRLLPTILESLSLDASIPVQSTQINPRALELFYCMRGTLALQIPDTFLSIPTLPLKKVKSNLFKSVSTQMKNTPPYKKLSDKIFKKSGRFKKGGHIEYIVKTIFESPLLSAILLRQTDTASLDIRALITEQIVHFILDLGYLEGECKLKHDTTSKSLIKFLLSDFVTHLETTIITALSQGADQSIEYAFDSIRVGDLPRERSAGEVLSEFRQHIFTIENRSTFVSLCLLQQLGHAAPLAELATAFTHTFTSSLDSDQPSSSTPFRTTVAIPAATYGPTHTTTTADRTFTSSIAPTQSIIRADSEKHTYASKPQERNDAVTTKKDPNVLVRTMRQDISEDTGRRR